MSRFPTEPIDHVPPLPPIDISPRCPVTVDDTPAERLSEAECDRIWNCVVQSASGSPMPAPIDLPAKKRLRRTAHENQHAYPVDTQRS